MNNLWCVAVAVYWRYRVFHNNRPKIIAYCSKIKSPGDFLGLWASHHIWSVWYIVLQMFHGDHLIVPQTLHQINNFDPNNGHKIHLLSSQSSCVSAFDLEYLKVISCDWACFTVSKTPPTLEIFHFQPWEICIWTW